MTESTLPPALEEILETFDWLETWEERYGYIIELGETLPGLPIEEQTKENKVNGCLSSVWLVAHADADDPSRMILSADSDSAIVKGLVAIVLAIFSGHTAEEIVGIEVSETFVTLGLSQHLSVSRRNGLSAMVKRIRQLATMHAASAHRCESFSTN
ncbi:MAG: SufE family protein [Planctomycetales bacterium]|nr:SufE family protein [Planctomycetales bacterium]